uniref:Coiled-coil domain-containing protein 86 n=1 Tax=Lotharella oceanica TaxID=641309 RepID=A0A7S2X7H6_9EUKA|mmetsp:Transcript_16752/g.31759  ORF Transcript_16752/g.31759 Transcript_16752/m.31759 type:complete len:140 (+) Transcript_16752:38-457(+)
MAAEAKAEVAMIMEAGEQGKSAQKVLGKALSATKRIWKKRPEKRTSAASRHITSDWAKRKRKRDLMRVAKEKQRAYFDRVRAEKAEERRKREQRKAYREEQEKKNEIVQVIKDVRKIKGMKKKHLRYIKKADTNTTKNS